MDKLHRVAEALLEETYGKEFEEILRLNIMSEFN